MEKLTARMELKLTEATMKALLEIEENHGLSPAVVCRKLADAAAQFYKTNGKFGFPITLSEEPITPTSPVQIKGIDSGGLPHTRKHNPKKRTVTNAVFRELKSDARRRKAHATTALVNKLRTQKPTAVGTEPSS